MKNISPMWRLPLLCTVLGIILNVANRFINQFFYAFSSFGLLGGNTPYIITMGVYGALSLVFFVHLGRKGIKGIPQGELVRSCVLLFLYCVGFRIVQTALITGFAPGNAGGISLLLSVLILPVRIFLGLGSLLQLIQLNTGGVFLSPIGSQIIRWLPCLTPYLLLLFARNEPDAEDDRYSEYRGPEL